MPDVELAEHELAIGATRPALMPYVGIPWPDFVVFLMAAVEALMFRAVTFSSPSAWSSCSACASTARTITPGVASFVGCRHREGTWRGTSSWARSSALAPTGGPSVGSIMPISVRPWLAEQFEFGPEALHPLCGAHRLERGHDD